MKIPCSRKTLGAITAALLAVLFALPAPAQPQQPSVASQSETKLYSDGVITVQVNDSHGGPLSGALIVLRGTIPGETYRQITRQGSADASGRARFADLPNAAYRADARMAGWLAVNSSTTFTQLEGAHSQGQMQLILRRLPVVTGRVVDERGTPLFAARVKAFRLARTEGGETYLEAGRGSNTDDRGIYRIVSEPGRYWVMGSHMEMSFPRGSAPRSTGVVFYPNSPDLLSAAPVELSFDQPETTRDIVLPAAPRTEVAAGILSGPDSLACTHCRYSLQRVEGALQYELAEGYSEKDAGFDLRGVPPGQYRVYVEDERSHQGWWAIEETAATEDRVTALTIQTRPPIAVSGRVTLEDPPREKIEQVPEGQIRVILQLNPVGAQFFGVRNGVAGQVELPLDQSEFTLGPFAPGRFRFEALVQGLEAYLAGIARQGRDLSSPVLDLAQPGGWNNLEVRLRFDLAQTKFRIAINAPANTPANAEELAYRFVLVPDAKENPFGRYAEGYCARDGQCYASSQPPGHYWVIAFRAGNQPLPDLRDPEVRDKVDMWGREINLAPGENPRIDLTLAPDKLFGVR